MENKLQSLKSYGNNSLSYLTISNDLLNFKGDWNGYFAYKKYFNSIVILGDPICPLKDMQKSIKDLKNIFSSKKTHICFFLNTNYSAESLISEEFKGLFIGQEAIVDLSKFTISGKKCWSIRSSVNYAKKHNMIVEEYDFRKKRSSNIENEIKRCRSSNYRFCA